MSLAAVAAASPREPLNELAIRTRITALGRLREYARGANLEASDTDPAARVALRIVSSGMVALVMHDPDPRPVALFGPGDVVDALRPDPIHGRWSLTALAVSNVHEIGEDALQGLPFEGELTAWRLRHERIARGRLLDLMIATRIPDVDERLLRLVRVAGLSTREGDRVHWPFTQTQFAALAGLSRAHLNTRLGVLRSSGRLVIEDRIAILGR